MKPEQKVKSICPNAIALLGMRNRWIVWEDARLSRHLSHTVKRTESAAYAQAWREIQTDPELYIRLLSSRGRMKSRVWKVRSLMIAAVSSIERLLHAASSVWRQLLFPVVMIVARHATELGEELGRGGDAFSHWLPEMREVQITVLIFGQFADVYEMRAPISRQCTNWHIAVWRRPAEE